MRETDRAALNLGIILMFAMLGASFSLKPTPKPAPNPNAARVRTLEAKVSRLQDELEFREFQTSSTILKGE